MLDNLVRSYSCSCSTYIFMPSSDRLLVHTNMLVDTVLVVGVDISLVAREAQATKPVCATCAIVPTGTNNEKAEKKGVSSHSSDFVPVGTMAQVAQNTPIEGEEDAADFNPTFADKLRRDDLPPYMKTYVKSSNRG